MSFPEEVIYRKKGFIIFNRQSEFEKTKKSFFTGNGLWIDCFRTIWFNKKIIKKINSKNLCFVSPELHGRKNFKKLWFFLKKLNIDKKISLCTDYPKRAKEFFYD